MRRKLGYHVRKILSLFALAVLRYKLAYARRCATKCLLGNNVVASFLSVNVARSLALPSLLKVLFFHNSFGQLMTLFCLPSIGPCFRLRLLFNRGNLFIALTCHRRPFFSRLCSKRLLSFLAVQLKTSFPFRHSSPTEGMSCGLQGTSLYRFLRNN